MVRWSWRVALDHLRPPQVVVVEGGGPPLPPCTFGSRPRQGSLYIGISLALILHGVGVLEQQLGEGGWSGGPGGSEFWIPRWWWWSARWWGPPPPPTTPAIR